MSMTYTWKIVEVGTKNAVNNENEVLEDAIVEVTWKKIGTNISGDSAVYVGTTALDPASTSAASFITYEDVTSSNIVDWLEATITDGEMERINNAIANKIAKLGITKRAFNN
jgi:hypothetical protein